MNNRKKFLKFLKGEKINNPLFFPDITTWYENTRKNIGEEEIFGPGVFISDNEDFHNRESRLSSEFCDMTFLDYYRKYNWGLPVHIYDWYKENYLSGIKRIENREGKKKCIEFKTPIGNISKTVKMGAEGSWVITDFFVKKISDLEIVKYIYKNREIIPDFNKLNRFYQETKGFGVCDLVIWRSPFGKLVHELMGFEEVVYGLHDNDKKKRIIDFLNFQTEIDLEIIKLAAKSPAKIIIISDHADETLISPRQYKDYCIPFYKKASKIVHNEGKYLSTHLDGNIKNYFPIIKDSKFDLLDGCTPSPMFNYTVEELSQVVDKNLRCYCGVPSTLFVQKLPTEDIVNFGLNIGEVFENQVIVNIGDILPPSGDIEQVIALGKAIKYSGSGG